MVSAMQADEKGSRCESGATAITVFGRNGNRRLGRQPLSGLLEKAFLLRPRVGAKSQETCHRDRQSTSGQTGSCSANRPSASSAKQASGLRGRMAGLCTGFLLRCLREDFCFSSSGDGCASTSRSRRLCSFADHDMRRKRVGQPFSFFPARRKVSPFPR